MMDWGQLIITLCGSGILTIALALLLREWVSTRIRNSIKHEYDKKIEEFKSIQQKELEGYKAGYQKFLDENRVRFNWWHEEQAKAIKEFYSKLSELNIALDVMVNPYKLTNGVDPKRQQEDDENHFLNAYIDSHEFYQHNKILLAKQHVNLLDKLYEKVILAIRNHGMSKNMNPHNFAAALQLSDRAVIEAKEINVILETLRCDFQTLLRGKSGDEK